MKDEEMAEEWVKENMDCCKTDNSVNRPIPYFDEEERCVAKSAFLAGLKAGRPKWHDLRKDPNDLPKEVGNYLVCYIDTMLNRNVFILEFVDFLEDSHWIDETSHEIEKFDEGVIAWCEIPEFEEAAV